MSLICLQWLTRFSTSWGNEVGRDGSQAGQTSRCWWLMLEVSYTHAGWNKQKINLRCQTSPRRTRTELPMGSHFWFALKLETSSDPFGCTSPAFWHRRTILSIFAPWHPETSESEGLGSPISRCVIWIFCHLKWSMVTLGGQQWWHQWDEQGQQRARDAAKAISASFETATGLELKWNRHRWAMKVEAQHGATSLSWKKSG